MKLLGYLNSQFTEFESPTTRYRSRLTQLVLEAILRVTEVLCSLVKTVGCLPGPSTFNIKRLHSLHCCVVELKYVSCFHQIVVLILERSLNCFLLCDNFSRSILRYLSF